MWLLGTRGKLTIALLSAIFWLRLSSYSLRPRFVCGLLLRVLVGAVIGSILHGSRDIDNSRCCEYLIKVKQYVKNWSVNLTLEWEGWLNNCSTGSNTIWLTHTPWPSLNKIGAHTTHDISYVQFIFKTAWWTQSTTDVNLQVDSFSNTDMWTAAIKRV